MVARCDPRRYVFEPNTSLFFSSSSSLVPPFESASGINYSSDRGLTCFLSVSRDELLIFRSIATQFLPLLPRVTSFRYQVSRTLDRFTVRQGRRSFNFFSPMEFDSNTEIETKIRGIALQLIK